MKKPKKEDDAHKGKIDPVDFTILPIADELLAFTKVLPPDLSKHLSIRFERLFSRVDVPLVTLRLDEGGFSYAAKKIEADLNKFLVRLRKWENKLHDTRVYSIEQLEELQKTNYGRYWKLRYEFAEICGDAEEIAKWLKKLAWLITQKRNGRKADNRDPASEQIKLKVFTFTEAQAFYKGKDLNLPSSKPVKILEMLVNSFGKAVRHNILDTESTTSNASDSLRENIATIRDALKRIPFKIESKRGFGYVLSKSR